MNRRTVLPPNLATTYRPAGRRRAPTRAHARSEPMASQRSAFASGGGEAHRRSTCCSASKPGIHPSPFARAWRASSVNQLRTLMPWGHRKLRCGVRRCSADSTALATPTLSKRDRIPEKTNIITATWVYTTKTDEHGRVVKAKVRLLERDLGKPEDVGYF